MGYDIETLEREVPIRLQRRLMLELSLGDPTAFSNIYHRWALRILIYNVNPELLLKDPPKEDQQPPQNGPSDPFQIPAIAEDVIFLNLVPKCLSSAQSSFASPAEAARTAFELFELGFATGNYDVCLQLHDLLLKAQLGERDSQRILAFTHVLQALGVMKPSANATPPARSPAMFSSLIEQLSNSPMDKSKLTQDLLALLEADVAKNEIGFATVERLLTRRDLFPRNVILHFASLQLVAAWFHSGGSFNTLQSRCAPLWAGAYIGFADEQASIRACLVKVSSLTERLVPSLLSQLGQNLFDNITTQFLRLIAWARPNCSGEEFGNIFEKNSPL